MSLQIKRHLLVLPQVRISTSSKWIGYLCTFSILAVIGVLFDNQSIGQGVVILFGILALLFGIKSEESFKLASASFGIIILTTVLGLNGLAQYFATYAFLLLCVGLACVIKEQWQPINDVLNRSYISGAYSRNYHAMPRGKQVFINRRSR